MKLLKLVLRNFKGCRDLVVEPNGKDLDIYGDNATGKTTVADAIFWILFGKDSQNRSDFEVKTLDADGKEIPGLDHIGIAEFEVPGKGRVTLERNYHEKVKVKRGTATDTTTSNTTSYKVNGVPVSENEYQAHVAGICSPEQFRILTDPYYFASTLKWQDRRKVLLEVCGDYSDREIINLNPNLKALMKPLDEGRSIDDHKKVQKASLDAAKKDIGSIPARIDEANLAIREVRPGDYEAEKKLLEESLASLMTKLSQSSHAQVIADKRLQLTECQQEIIALKNELCSAPDPTISAAKAAKDTAYAAWMSASNATREAAQVVARIEGEIRVIAEHADQREGEIDRLSHSIELHKKDQAALREAFAAIKGESFTGSTSCPGCGQQLPYDQVQSAVAAWNADQARRKEQNNSEGKKLAAAIERANARIAEVQAEIAKLNDKRESKNQDLAMAKSALAAAEEFEVCAKSTHDASEIPSPKFVDPSTHPDFVAIFEKGQALKAEIDALESGQSDARKPIQDQIEMVKAAIAQCDLSIAAKAQESIQKRRIQELKDLEKKLAATIESLQADIFLCEEFVKAKVRLLTERINDRFSIARFKLFDEQQNGGIAECCEVTQNGVPFRDLNHGMQVNVGIDIINTLADHFLFAPMVILDNAESVTQIAGTRGQQIRLIVSASDKTLRTETSGESLAPDSLQQELINVN